MSASCFIQQSWRIIARFRLVWCLIGMISNTNVLLRHTKHVNWANHVYFGWNDWLQRYVSLFDGLVEAPKGSIDRLSNTPNLVIDKNPTKRHRRIGMYCIKLAHRRSYSQSKLLTLNDAKHPTWFSLQLTFCNDFLIASLVPGSTGCALVAWE